MILEKLTVDEDSLIFFACSALSFFAISLFSIIVSLSAIQNIEQINYFQYLEMDYSQTCQSM